jgi:hypothetical protein
MELSTTLLNGLNDTWRRLLEKFTNHSD